jgi:hypothetical protein
MAEGRRARSRAGRVLRIVYPVVPTVAMHAVEVLTGTFAGSALITDALTLGAALTVDRVVAAADHVSARVTAWRRRRHGALGPHGRRRPGAHRRRATVERKAPARAAPALDPAQLARLERDIAALRRDLGRARATRAARREGRLRSVAELPDGRQVRTGKILRLPDRGHSRTA